MIKVKASINGKSGVTSFQDFRKQLREIKKEALKCKGQHNKGLGCNYYIEIQDPSCSYTRLPMNLFFTLVVE